MLRHQSLFISVFGLGMVGALAACTGDQGDPGAAGKNALVKTTAEPAGANCPNGGTKVEVGLDSNGNGTLDPGEVGATGTSYVCSGSGKSSLVKTSPEPAGANCPSGGSKIETGLDANNDATLQASEVIPGATSYVCNISPSGTISPSTGVTLAIKPNGVSTQAGAPITVRFTLKDDRGFPLDLKGNYSLNTPILPRFALAYFTKDATTGFVSPLTVYTKAASATSPTPQPTLYNPSTGVAQGTVVENGFGAGDYTYTFPTATTANGPVAVAYDATKLNQTHVVWIQVTRQTDLLFTINASTFYAANVPFYYVPDASAPPLQREIVSQAGCDSCHKKFRAENTSSSAFHGGGRVESGMCNVCHNPARTAGAGAQADSVSFVHRIHNGDNVAPANLFHGIAATYPQDIRKCDTCHAGAAQGNQAQDKPTILACSGCHDYVSFNSGAPKVCEVNGRLERDPATGLPVPCNHAGGPQADDTCISCHGAGKSFATTRYHKPVVAPDPNNIWNTPTGGNHNTHASHVAAAGYVPPGAIAFTYDVKSVTAVLDATVTPNVYRPQIVFKLKTGAADVVFQSFAPAADPPVTELLPNFVGSPSVYFAWGVPQDGIAFPADFNASASGYVKNIWNGSATGTGAGTMTGPDASGYYTIKLTGVQVPPPPSGSTASADVAAQKTAMLTGGLGYTYGLGNPAPPRPSLPVPPLVQINVPEYPWIPSGLADGKAQGGLSVPAPNVWKVATGYHARRPIVDNAKCKSCHGALGVAPNFHAGQRNDGPSCSFCHNPNRTSSGWSAGSKYFIHAIHAGRGASGGRTVNYTWHAAAKGPGYDEVEFPGTLNTCTTCHVRNTYDFTEVRNLTAVANMQLTTVASGKYNRDELSNPATYYTISPYVIADNVKDYGGFFSHNAGTGVSTPAAATTLVLSPITGACSACHDSTIAINHMTANGGQFYAERSTVLAAGATEQCLICHGPGRSAAIGSVHLR
jgi:OmcA/MtrC family decaheme c-type cytochrome